jgi:hypothetical protein
MRTATPIFLGTKANACHFSGKKPMFVKRKAGGLVKDRPLFGVGSASR